MNEEISNSQEIEAFLSFAQQIILGKEGAFFVLNRKEIERMPTWAFGYGKKKCIKFDDSVFPKFCTSNFLGNKNYVYTFKDSYTSFDKSFESHESLLPIKKKLELPYKLSLQEPLFVYASETEASFVEKVKNIQKFEKEGNAWVMNMTQNITGNLPKGISKKLLLLSSFYHFLKSGSVVCGGVLITDEQLFCSFSPEVFLKQDGNEISTFPIKGTGQKEELKNSEKEISELHMVTDLLRNDFGQICNSIKVKRERYLTKEKDFYHAQSEIMGVLTPLNARGVFKGRSNNNRVPLLNWEKFQLLLPAGSISGAPKKKVIEKILDLENFDRRFYTGTFGVQFSSEKSIYNILLRTLFLGEKHWYFPVGAGITVESDPFSEYKETLQKAKVFERFCVE